MEELVPQGQREQEAQEKSGQYQADEWPGARRIYAGVESHGIKIKLSVV
tara:strand:- start:676 stop:822 length:147 start_codon:yes stop_codon:yes gene_type:complete